MDKHEEQRALAIKALREPLPVGLLLEPIEYVFADHFRQRSLCVIIERISEQSDVDREMVQSAFDFLVNDFGVHVIDEEEDLFPLLRRRALPEDAIEDILGQLSQEHALDQIDGEHVVGVLRKLLEGKKEACDKTDQDLFKRFACNEKRHLICENAIVLPLARVRLTNEDMRNLGRRMAARRGVDYPGIENAH
jgi:hemerythrin-like domain-containing protein